MSEETKIQWTDHTFNPWIGCTKVSPGCLHCYAESEDKRRKWTEGGWGKGQPRKRTKTWNQPVAWNKETWYECEGCGKRFGIQIPPGQSTLIPACFRCKDCGATGLEHAQTRARVFCASLADWLDDEVPIEWLADLLDLIRRTPNLDWQLLTKRPENWDKRLCHDLAAYSNPTYADDSWGWIAQWIEGNPPANVWMGTSVEDQTRAAERIPKLQEIPARVRFLSVEPMLGAINIRGLRAYVPHPIDWVICGGESGPGARPFELEWARDLKRQCAAAGVAFFLKQLGALPQNSGPFISGGPVGLTVELQDKKGGDMAEWPEDLRIREFPQP